MAQIKAGRELSVHEFLFAHYWTFDRVPWTLTESIPPDWGLPAAYRGHARCTLALDRTRELLDRDFGLGVTGCSISERSAVTNASSGPEVSKDNDGTDARKHSHQETWCERS